MQPLFVRELTLCYIYSDLTCLELPNPENGLVTITGTDIGDLATYSCNEGFVLEGDATRTCGQPGFWSGAEPICKCMYSLIPVPPFSAEEGLVLAVFWTIIVVSCT